MHIVYFRETLHKVNRQKPRFLLSIESVRNIKPWVLVDKSHIEDARGEAEKHPQASLDPSEVVTLAILFALKGAGHRAF
jgi:hypothetical protein